MRPGRGRRAREASEWGNFMITNITEELRCAFQALTSGDYGNFAVFSVLVDGEPGAAVVAVNESPPTGEGGEPEFEFLSRRHVAGRARSWRTVMCAILRATCGRPNRQSCRFVIARLAALVPRSRLNPTRFHGVFAPNCKHRERIVPRREPEASKPGQPLAPMA